MSPIWGIVLIIFTLILCWLAQILNAFSPALAARWRLTKPESNVDLSYCAVRRGEVVWGALILWISPAAGILLHTHDSARNDEFGMKPPPSWSLPSAAAISCMGSEFCQRVRRRICGLLFDDGNINFRYSLFVKQSCHYVVAGLADLFK